MVYTDPQTSLRIGRALETRWDSLLSHPDSCPANGVHLSALAALTPQPGEDGGKGRIAVLAHQQSDGDDDLAAATGELQPSTSASQTDDVMPGRPAGAWPDDKT
jgi:hypothetical protein